MWVSKILYLYGFYQFRKLAFFYMNLFCLLSDGSDLQRCGLNKRIWTHWKSMILRNQVGIYRNLKSISCFKFVMLRHEK